MASSEPPTKKKKTSVFRLELPGIDAKEVITSKMMKARDILQRQFQKCLNNRNIVENVLDFFLERVHGASSPLPTFTTYQQVVNKEDENLFVSSPSSAMKLLEIAENHAKLCTASLHQERVTISGHVAVVKMKCPNNPLHTYTWSSSPHTEDKKFLVNHKMLMGFSTSGILPVQYERFAKTANIGFLSKKARKNNEDIMRQCIEEEYEESTEDAVMKEMGMTLDTIEDGINVMSDARHSTRRNAKDTSVVVIGEKSHQVMVHEHITKKDDSVTQRHERLGTNNVMDAFEEKGIDVNIWIHDNNASVNTDIKKRGIISANDLWHGIKNLKKVIMKVTCGPKKNHNKIWHHQLDDKLLPIATHAHYAARRAAGNGQALQKDPDSIVEHYKNNHKHCHPTSRCKTDPKYEPSRKTITDPKAESLLRKAIHDCMIYKQADSFSYGRDTHYVESFNVLNIFQDKRISFSSEEYKRRSQLAVLHWNENVDRSYTSVYTKPSPANRRGRTKRNYKATTYTYKVAIWNRYLQKIKNTQKT